MVDRFIKYPFQHGSRGIASATEDADQHLRDKVEAVLFTAPGERVNRPDFGAGLNQMVFEPLDEMTVAALEYRVSTALERDVGDEIIVDEVRVEANQAFGELILHLGFTRRRDRKPGSLEIVL